MTDDLTTRLRAAGHDERLSTGQLYLDAADEIDRLSAALTQLDHLIDATWIAVRSAPDDYREHKWGLSDAVAHLRQRAEQAEALADRRLALLRRCIGPLDYLITMPVCGAEPDEWCALVDALAAELKGTPNGTD